MSALLYWFPCICSCSFGGLMVLAALLSYRNEQVRSQLLSIYERGARRSLHPEIATRSAPIAALGTGVGMILFSGLTLLPLPRGLQLFPPLWIPAFGAGIGYVFTWNIVQKRAREIARRRGRLQADLTMRQARHYLRWHHFLTPWLLVFIWTAVLALQLGPSISKHIRFMSFNVQESTLTLNWFDVLGSPGMGLLLALAGWLLLKSIVQAPRVLPPDDIELAAITDDAIRQEAIRHVHVGTLGSIALLLLGPTFLIQNTWLRSILVLLLFLITFGLLNAPTLFHKAMWSRASQRLSGKEK